MAFFFRMIVARIIPEARAVQTILRRNYGVSAVMMKASDPIQQLFVDKIHEYTKKSKYVINCSYFFLIICSFYQLCKQLSHYIYSGQESGSRSNIME